MARLTGGQALVKSLIGNGVETLFALPGVQLDHMFNALHDEGNAIRVINTRHEQGAAYMALGYSLASGDVGVVVVSVATIAVPLLPAFLYPLFGRRRREAPA